MVVALLVLVMVSSSCIRQSDDEDVFAQLPVVTTTAWVAPSEVSEIGPPPSSTVVEVTVEDDIESLMMESPPGTTFEFGPGVYREFAVRPRTGDVFLGDEGAVLSGSRLLSGFIKVGELWAVGGLDAEGERRGTCVDHRPMCSFPEDLYMDGERLRQVESLGDVRPGKWFFDYESDIVYVGDDPSVHSMELATVPYAFVGAAVDVFISGFVIEKYANPAQRGAIGGEGTGSGWVIVSNEIRMNHGIGVKAGTDTTIAGNYVHHNGQLGLGGSGAGILVQGNEIAYNNSGGFSPFWGGGGAKFVKTRDLVVDGNYVHHNLGPGLWTDIDNENTTYTRNLVVVNYHAGIKHEISYGAYIAENRVESNGFGNPYKLAGAGIFVSSSSDVEVSNNIVRMNKDGIGGLERDRGSGTRGEYRLANLYVHDNTISMSSGHTGVISTEGKNGVFRTWGNRFEGNRYSLEGDDKYFYWNGRSLTLREWQDLGFDLLSSEP